MLEVRVFDHLPALHDLRAAAETDLLVPIGFEILGGELADVVAVGGEGDGVDATLLRVFFLLARDHVVQDAVHEVFYQADVGDLVVVAD